MELFNVYVDRLKDGHTEKVNEIVEPSFLEVSEKELSFPNPVSVAGEIYLAEDHLIFHLRVKTEARIPCAICNEFFLQPVDADIYHAVPLEELKSPIFQYTPLIRESLLLQVPPFSECSDGGCPERSKITPYLKKESQGDDAHVQFPFSDLEC